MKKEWRPVWTTAPSRGDPSDAQWGCDVTLRYRIYTAVSGGRIRLRLSNLHGKHAVTVGRVSVARYAAGGRIIDPATITPVTVCFGDSITAQSWPDHLALATKDRAVVRRAVSGTRVLRAYDCLTYQSYGDKGADRFEREVCMPGVDSVLIMHGINDIIHPDGVNPYRPLCDLPTAEELIEGLRFYIRTAHAHGIKAYLMTILPFGGWRTDVPEKEAILAAVNDWILHNDEADGAIDAARAVRDPDRPDRLLPAFDSGDHLHPSDAGAHAIAAAVCAECPVFNGK